MGLNLEFEARVRTNAMPSGLVTSFFTHTFVGNLADEIDYEFLTKQINAASTGSQPVLLTTWNDWDANNPTYGDGVHNWSVNPVVAGLDMSGFNTFTVRWMPDHTDWLINGNLIYSTTLALADAPMPVRLNFWAPDASWAEAYDSGLQPTSNPTNNQSYFYDVDYVQVRVAAATPEPGAIMTGFAGAIAGGCLLLRRRRSARVIARLK